MLINGSKIYIGLRVAPKQEVVLADFTPQELAWTEIKGWVTSGSLGDTQELVSQPHISEDRPRQFKGTRVGATMENGFTPMPNDPGQIKFKKAIEDCSPSAFKVEWGAGCESEAVVTMTVAGPGVVTWPGGHGLEANSPVIFTPTGGTLPAPLVAGTVYYVVGAGLTPTTFAVSTAPGIGAITTTAAGTATSITATAQPVGETDLFFGLAMPGAKQGGGVNTARTRNWSIMPDSNIIEV